jgi:large subunit ribosomal protein L10
MPNLVNDLICKELEQEFDSVDGMLLVSFGGLSVAETEVLRGRLAADGVRFRMVRNSLAERVLAARGLSFPDGTFVGNVAIAYGKPEHAILAAKTLSQPEVKKAGKVSFKAGILEGRVLPASDAAALADIPDRPTLQARLLSCISGPARGIVGSIHAVPSALARVLQARVDAASEAE